MGKMITANHANEHEPGKSISPQTFTARQAATKMKTFMERSRPSAAAINLS